MFCVYWGVRLRSGLHVVAATSFYLDIIKICSHVTEKSEIIKLDANVVHRKATVLQAGVTLTRYSGIFGGAPRPSHMLVLHTD